MQSECYFRICLITFSELADVIFFVKLEMKLGKTSPLVVESKPISQKTQLSRKLVLSR